MTALSYKIENHQDKHYAIITLHKEGKFNPELLAEFNQALDTTLAKGEVQTLIICGTDKNFSQGLDLEAMSKMEALVAKNFVNDCMAAIERLLLFPMPVVSAVNGHAFGLGAMIVMASDYAVMREDKGFFCMPEIDIRMNLIPSMNALVTHKLQGRVLRDVLLTGKRVGGVETARLGIVDDCCSEANLLTVARQLPLPMMGKDRNVLQQLKKGIHQNILPSNFWND